MILGLGLLILRWKRFGARLTLAEGR